MIAAFNERRPLAAALVAFVFGPFVGMLYLSRARLALAYFAASLATVAVPFLPPFNNVALSARDLVGLASLALQAVGAIHCFMVAKHRDMSAGLKWYARWYALVGFELAPLLIAVLFRIFAFEPFDIPSVSMNPTLKVGDYLFAKKFAYTDHEPARGDVIIFTIDGVHYIKRIIGIPGDVVSLTHDVPTINGHAATHEAVEDFVQAGHHSHQFIETLPDGVSYRILTGSEYDSIDQPEITVPEGHYFVLGDNRGQSRDSRYEGVGMVPREHIIGKAMSVLFNNAERAK